MLMSLFLLHLEEAHLYAAHLQAAMHDLQPQIRPSLVRTVRE